MVPSPDNHYAGAHDSCPDRRAAPHRFDNYDYFWIVDFPPNSNVPSKFTMVKQEFGGPFANLPQNDWDTPNGLDASSGCKLKDAN